MAVISDYFYQEEAEGRIVEKTKVGDQINYKGRKWIVIDVYPYWVKLRAISPALAEPTSATDDQDKWLQFTSVTLGDLIIGGYEDDGYVGNTPTKSKGNYRGSYTKRKE